MYLWVRCPDPDVVCDGCSDSKLDSDIQCARARKQSAHAMERGSAGGEGERGIEYSRVTGGPNESAGPPQRHHTGVIIIPNTKRAHTGGVGARAGESRRRGQPGTAAAYARMQWAHACKQRWSNDRRATSPPCGDDHRAAPHVSVTAASSAPASAASAYDRDNGPTTASPRGPAAQSRPLTHHPCGDPRAADSRAPFDSPRQQRDVQPCHVLT